MASNGLIIMIKNPIKGQVKTRLAEVIGDEQALQMYLYLLNFTRKITEQLGCDKLLYYSSFIDHSDAWDEQFYQKYLQNGCDFGERMYHAFEEAFATHQHVAIIGSDCPELTAEIIEHVFAKLESFDMVIGPAEDGGYYLLGLNDLQPEFFHNKHWSTASVYSETLSDAQALDLTIFQLPVLSDVDTYEDLPNMGPIFEEGNS